MSTNKLIAKRHFQFSLGMTVLCAFFLLLFLLLSAWQFNRYHQKKNLQLNYSQRMQMKPILLSRINNYSDQQFRRVLVTGHYLNNRTMLLENRFYKRHLGYEVITPFQVAHSNKILLVNRGWIPREQGSDELIWIKKNSEQQTIMGYIKLWNSYHFILGDSILNPGKWPLLLQKIDINKIKKLTRFNLYPFVLRLDAKETHGFVRDWRTMNTLPQRHLGYAIQWLVLALATLIAYFVFSFRSSSKH